MSEQSLEVRLAQAEAELRDVKLEAASLGLAADRIKWLCRKYREMLGHRDDAGSFLAQTILSELGEAADNYIPF